MSIMKDKSILNSIAFHPRKGGEKISSFEAYTHFLTKVVTRNQHRDRKYLLTESVENIIDLRDLLAYLYLHKTVWVSN